MAAPRRAQPLHRRAAPQPRSPPPRSKTATAPARARTSTRRSSRRHELRRLIEDLADLPEQQRAALLMRELDGLSHDEVADALEISPAASRAAGQARADRAGRRRRGARRRLRRDPRRPADRPRRAPPARPSTRCATCKTCDACREFRDNLKADALAAARARPADRHGPAGRRPAPDRRRRGRDLQARRHRGLLRGAGRRRGDDARRGAALGQGRRHRARRARAATGHRGRRQGADRQADPRRARSCRRTSRSRTSGAAERRRARKIQAARARLLPAPGCVGAGLAIPRTADGKERARPAAHVPVLLSRHGPARARHGPPHGQRSATPPSPATPRPVLVSVGTLCKRR